MEAHRVALVDLHAARVRVAVARVAQDRLAFVCFARVCFNVSLQSRTKHKEKMRLILYTLPEYLIYTPLASGTAIIYLLSLTLSRALVSAAFVT